MGESDSTKRDGAAWLAGRFEENRGHLRAVAFRMLGSLSEADDAVQEAWLHATRGGASGVDNLGGWLTTIVARVCLDMLRSRRSRREEPLGEPRPPVAASRASADAPPRAVDPPSAANPEQEAALADSVGLALLVVLDALAPAERIAFVLHDLFALSFDEIAPVVGRSPAAARQLASRARRRVQGAPKTPEPDLSSQRKVVQAFLAALRGADFEGLVAVLDPECVVQSDATATPPEGREMKGARNWAKGAIGFAKGASALRPALVDGAVGLVLAPRGRLTRVIAFTFANDRVATLHVMGDAERLRELDIALLPD